MKDNLLKYTCYCSNTILEALKKIDSNKKGFLVVIDDNENVIGTLTDGDIRRAFINGIDKDNDVKGILNSTCKCVNSDDDIGIVINIFKDNKFKFLPIIRNNKLINIITKKQLDTLLLTDLRVDLSYDFESIDENIISSEIYPRPWGFYKTTVLNSYYQSKIICVNPNQMLSLQSHEHRDEYWIIAHGDGEIQLGDELKIVKSGDIFVIPRNIKHRIKNISDKDNLIITEVQLGDYFGEDDIKRYEDIYGRK